MNDEQKLAFGNFLSKFTKKSGKNLGQRTVKTVIVLSKYFPELQPNEPIETVAEKCKPYLEQRSYPIARYSLWLYLAFLNCPEASIKQIIKFERRNKSALTDDEKLAKSVLSKEEILKLIDNVRNERDNLIIRLLYDTACRVSELCSVKKMDVNFSNNEIQVMGKGGKPRVVYFHDETKSLLEKWNSLNKFDSADLVFSIKPITVWFNLKKYGKELLNKDLHPHMFRHTRLQHMADVGVDGLSIKAYAGHEDVRTTQIYVKSSKFQRKIAFEKAGNIWGGPPEKNP